MSFRFRVVPQKKRRKARSHIVKKPFARRSLESWLTDPSIEQRVSRRLPAYVYASLESISSPTTYGKDTVLFVEGQKPTGAFVVRKGCVKLSASSADGKSLIVGRAEAGDVLGLPTAISGRDKGAICKSLTIRILRSRAESVLFMVHSPSTRGPSTIVAGLRAVAESLPAFERADV